ncbi:MAG: patatin-like phospholipase family protein [Acidobacteria bacterium]|nr:patatin-like phospholipase family protein [Acidobacteriota bacterium]
MPWVSRAIHSGSRLLPDRGNAAESRIDTRWSALRRLPRDRWRNPVRRRSAVSPVRERPPSAPAAQGRTSAAPPDLTDASGWRLRGWSITIRVAPPHPLNGDPVHSSSRVADGPLGRALVLHGGGAAGNAWEIGVVAGLLEAGLDVTHPDLTVGTSAGATVAAQLTAATPGDLLAAILDAAPRSPSPPAGRRTGSGSTVDHLERTNRIIAAASDAVDMRRRMGAAALELEAGLDGSWSARWRVVVAGRLPGARWPRRRLLITAVDARTGAPVTFDRGSCVDLVDAVAASTSSGLPYAIGDHRYIDGGYRRNENADLAIGYRRVLVLSPFGGRSRHPPEWGLQLAAQVHDLQAAGSAVDTIVPDAAALAAFGDDMMNLSARPAAARAGREQGRDAAARLADVWS